MGREFRVAAAEFDFSASNGLDLSDAELRVLNDQMQGFEKTFLLYEGLPDRIQYRHVVTAPSLFDAYGGSAFPGIGDLIYKLDQIQDQESVEYKTVMKQIKKHVSELMIIIKRAAHYIKPHPIPGSKIISREYSTESDTLSCVCILQYVLI